MCTGEVLETHRLAAWRPTDTKSPMRSKMVLRHPKTPQGRTKAAHQVGPEDLPTRLCNPQCSFVLRMQKTTLFFNCFCLFLRLGLPLQKALGLSGGPFKGILWSNILSMTQQGLLRPAKASQNIPKDAQRSPGGSQWIMQEAPPELREYPGAPETFRKDPPFPKQKAGK